jgi:hypothetical protein
LRNEDGLIALIQQVSAAAGRQAAVLVGGDCQVLLDALAALQEQGDEAGEQEKLHQAGGTGCPRSDRPPRQQRTASAGLPPGEHRR